MKLETIQKDSAKSKSKMGKISEELENGLINRTRYANNLDHDKYIKDKIREVLDDVFAKHS